MVCVAEIFSDAVLSELSSSTDLFSCSFVFPSFFSFHKTSLKQSQKSSTLQASSVSHSIVTSATSFRIMEWYTLAIRDTKALHLLTFPSKKTEFLA